MSESFHSKRFDKNVWLTNHAIESMAKRSITLEEVKQLIEEGEYRSRDPSHSWIYRYFPACSDNLMCAAVINEQALIVKTVMIRWQKRTKQ
ncbi:MAG: DUF4258 domain-containing protein [Pseudomonadota bacterium]|nr:DUF4258 domain-containing protein [Pseudomonadota bacterium]